MSNGFPIPLTGSYGDPPASVVDDAFIERIRVSIGKFETALTQAARFDPTEIAIQNYRNQCEQRVQQAEAEATVQAEKEAITNINVEWQTRSHHDHQQINLQQLYNNTNSRGINSPTAAAGITRSVVMTSIGNQNTSLIDFGNDNNSKKSSHSGFPSATTKQSADVATSDALVVGSSNGKHFLSNVLNSNEYGESSGSTNKSNGRPQLQQQQPHHPLASNLTPTSFALRLKTRQRLARLNMMALEGPTSSNYRSAVETIKAHQQANPVTFNILDPKHQQQQIGTKSTTPSSPSPSSPNGLHHQHGTNNSSSGFIVIDVHASVADTLNKEHARVTRNRQGVVRRSSQTPSSSPNDGHSGLANFGSNNNTNSIASSKSPVLHQASPTDTTAVKKSVGFLGANNNGNKRQSDDSSYPLSSLDISRLVVTSQSIPTNRSERMRPMCTIAHFESQLLGVDKSHSIRKITDDSSRTDRGAFNPHIILDADNPDYKQRLLSSIDTRLFIDGTANRAYQLEGGFIIPVKNRKVVKQNVIASRAILSAQHPSIIVPDVLVVDCAVTNVFFGEGGSANNTGDRKAQGESMNRNLLFGGGAKDGGFEFEYKYPFWDVGSESLVNLTKGAAAVDNDGNNDDDDDGFTSKMKDPRQRHSVTPVDRDGNSNTSHRKGKKELMNQMKAEEAEEARAKRRKALPRRRLNTHVPTSCVLVADSRQYSGVFGITGVGVSGNAIAGQGHHHSGGGIVESSQGSPYVAGSPRSAFPALGPITPAAPSIFSSSNAHSNNNSGGGTEMYPGGWLGADVSLRDPSVAPVLDAIAIELNVILTGGGATASTAGITAFEDLIRKIILIGGSSSSPAASGVDGSDLKSRSMSSSSEINSLSSCLLRDPLPPLRLSVARRFATHALTASTHTSSVSGSQPKEDFLAKSAASVATLNEDTLAKHKDTIISLLQAEAQNLALIASNGSNINTTSTFVCVRDTSALLPVMFPIFPISFEKMVEERFRPEFIRDYTVPLLPTACYAECPYGSQPAYIQQNFEATLYFFNTTIPTCAAALDAFPEAGQDLCDRVHMFGINLRYLGWLIPFLKNETAICFVYTEIAARSYRHIERQKDAEGIDRERKAVRRQRIVEDRLAREEHKKYLKRLEEHRRKKRIARKMMSQMLHDRDESTQKDDDTKVRKTTTVSFGENDYVTEGKDNFANRTEKQQQVTAKGATKKNVLTSHSPLSAGSPSEMSKVFATSESFSGPSPFSPRFDDGPDDYEENDDDDFADEDFDEESEEEEEEYEADETEEEKHKKSSSHIGANQFGRLGGTPSRSSKTKNESPRTRNENVSNSENLKRRGEVEDELSNSDDESFDDDEENFLLECLDDDEDNFIEMETNFDMLTKAAFAWYFPPHLKIPLPTMSPAGFELLRRLDSKYGIIPETMEISRTGDEADGRRRRTLAAEGIADTFDFSNLPSNFDPLPSAYHYSSSKAEEEGILARNRSSVSIDSSTSSAGSSIDRQEYKNGASREKVGNNEAFSSNDNNYNNNNNKGNMYASGFEYPSLITPDMIDGTILQDRISTLCPRLKRIALPGKVSSVSRELYISKCPLPILKIYGAYLNEALLARSEHCGEHSPRIVPLLLALAQISARLNPLESATSSAIPSLAGPLPTYPSLRRSQKNRGEFDDGSVGGLEDDDDDALPISSSLTYLRSAQSIYRPLSSPEEYERKRCMSITMNGTSGSFEDGDRQRRRLALLRQQLEQLNILGILKEGLWRGKDNKSSVNSATVGDKNDGYGISSFFSSSTDEIVSTMLSGKPLNNSNSYFSRQLLRGEVLKNLPTRHQQLLLQLRHRDDVHVPYILVRMRLAQLLMQCEDTANARSECLAAIRTLSSGLTIENGNTAAGAETTNEKDVNPLHHFSSQSHSSDASSAAQLLPDDLAHLQIHNTSSSTNSSFASMPTTILISLLSAIITPLFSTTNGGASSSQQYNNNNNIRQKKDSRGNDSLPSSYSSGGNYGGTSYHDSRLFVIASILKALEANGVRLLSQGDDRDISTTQAGHNIITHGSPSTIVSSQTALSECKNLSTIKASLLWLLFNILNEEADNAYYFGKAKTSTAVRSSDGNKNSSGDDSYLPPRPLTDVEASVLATCYSIVRLRLPAAHHFRKKIESAIADYVSLHQALIVAWESGNLPPPVVVGDNNNKNAIITAHGESEINSQLTAEREVLNEFDAESVSRSLETLLLLLIPSHQQSSNFKNPTSNPQKSPAFHLGFNFNNNFSRYILVGIPIPLSELLGDQHERLLVSHDHERYVPERCKFVDVISIEGSSSYTAVSDHSHVVFGTIDGNSNNILNSNEEGGISSNSLHSPLPHAAAFRSAMPTSASFGSRGKATSKTTLHNEKDNEEVENEKFSSTVMKNIFSSGNQNHSTLPLLEVVDGFLNNGGGGAAVGTVGSIFAHSDILLITMELCGKTSLVSEITRRLLKGIPLTPYSNASEDMFNKQGLNQNMKNNNYDKNQGSSLINELDGGKHGGVVSSGVGNNKNKTKTAGITKSGSLFGVSATSRGQQGDDVKSSQHKGGGTTKSDLLANLSQNYNVTSAIAHEGEDRNRGQNRHATTQDSRNYGGRVAGGGASVTQTSPCYLIPLIVRPLSAVTIVTDRDGHCKGHRPCADLARYGIPFSFHSSNDKDRNRDDVGMRSSAPRRTTTTTTMNGLTPTASHFSTSLFEIDEELPRWIKASTQMLTKTTKMTISQTQTQRYPPDSSLRGTVAAGETFVSAEKFKARASGLAPSDAETTEKIPNHQGGRHASASARKYANTKHQQQSFLPDNTINSGKGRGSSFEEEDLSLHRARYCTTIEDVLALCDPPIPPSLVPELQRNPKIFMILEMPSRTLNAAHVDLLWASILQVVTTQWHNKVIIVASESYISLPITGDILSGGGLMGISAIIDKKLHEEALALDSKNEVRNSASELKSTGKWASKRRPNEDSSSTIHNYSESHEQLRAFISSRGARTPLGMPISVRKTPKQFVRFGACSLSRQDVVQTLVRRLTKGLSEALGQIVSANYLRLEVEEEKNRGNNSIFNAGRYPPYSFPNLSRQQLLTKVPTTNANGGLGQGGASDGAQTRKEEETGEYDAYAGGADSFSFQPLSGKKSSLFAEEESFRCTLAELLQTNNEPGEFGDDNQPFSSFETPFTADDDFSAFTSDVSMGDEAFGSDGKPITAAEKINQNRSKNRNLLALRDGAQMPPIPVIVAFVERILDDEILNFTPKCASSLFSCSSTLDVALSGTPFFFDLQSMKLGASASNCNSISSTTSPNCLTNPAVLSLVCDALSDPTLCASLVQYPSTFDQVLKPSRVAADAVLNMCSGIAKGAGVAGGSARMNINGFDSTSLQKNRPSSIFDTRGSLGPFIGTIATASASTADLIMNTGIKDQFKASANNFTSAAMSVSQPPSSSVSTSSKHAAGAGMSPSNTAMNFMNKVGSAISSVGARQMTSDPTASNNLLSEDVNVLNLSVADILDAVLFQFISNETSVSTRCEAIFFACEVASRLADSGGTSITLDSSVTASSSVNPFGKRGTASCEYVGSTTAANNQQPQQRNSGKKRYSVSATSAENAAIEALEAKKLSVINNNSLISLTAKCVRYARCLPMRISFVLSDDKPRKHTNAREPQKEKGSTENNGEAGEKGEPSNVSFSSSSRSSSINSPLLLLRAEFIHPVFQSYFRSLKMVLETTPLSMTWATAAARFMFNETMIVREKQKLGTANEHRKSVFNSAAEVSKGRRSFLGPLPPEGRASFMLAGGISSTVNGGVTFIGLASADGSSPGGGGSKSGGGGLSAAVGLSSSSSATSPAARRRQSIAKGAASDFFTMGTIVVTNPDNETMTVGSLSSPINKSALHLNLNKKGIAGGSILKSGTSFSTSPLDSPNRKRDGSFLIKNPLNTARGGPQYPLKSNLARRKDIAGNVAFSSALVNGSDSPASESASTSAVAAAKKTNKKRQLQILLRTAALFSRAPQRNMIGNEWLCLNNIAFETDLTVLRFLCARLLSLDSLQAAFRKQIATKRSQFGTFTSNVVTLFSQSGLSLSGVNLRGVDMRNVKLDGVCLFGADLRQTRWTSASAIMSIVDCADLTAAKGTLMTEPLLSITDYEVGDASNMGIEEGRLLSNKNKNSGTRITYFGGLGGEKCRPIDPCDLTLAVSSAHTDSSQPTNKSAVNFSALLLSSSKVGRLAAPFRKEANTTEKRNPLSHRLPGLLTSSPSSSPAKGADTANLFLSSFVTPPVATTFAFEPRSGGGATRELMYAIGTDQGHVLLCDFETSTIKSKSRHFSPSSVDPSSTSSSSSGIPHIAPIQHVCFNSEGDLLLSFISGSDKIFVWRTIPTLVVACVLSSQALHSASTSPSAKRVFGVNGTASIQSSMAAHGPFVSAFFGVDSSFVVAATSFGSILLWRIEVPPLVDELSFDAEAAAAAANSALENNNDFHLNTDNSISSSPSRSPSSFGIRNSLVSSSPTRTLGSPQQQQQITAAKTPMRLPPLPRTISLADADLAAAAATTETVGDPSILSPRSNYVYRRARQITLERQRQPLKAFYVSEPQVLYTHSCPITSFSYEPLSNHCAFLDQRKALTIRNVGRNTIINQFSTTKESIFRLAAAGGANTSTLMSGISRSTAEAPLSSGPLDDHQLIMANSIRGSAAMAITPSGTRVAVATSTTGITLFDAKTTEALCTLRLIPCGGDVNAAGARDPPHSIHFSHDETYMVAAEGERWYLWHVAKSKLLFVFDASNELLLSLVTPQVIATASSLGSAAHLLTLQQRTITRVFVDSFALHVSFTLSTSLAVHSIPLLYCLASENFNWNLRKWITERAEERFRQSNVFSESELASTGNANLWSPSSGVSFAFTPNLLKKRTSASHTPSESETRTNRAATVAEGNEKRKSVTSVGDPSLDASTNNTGGVIPRNTLGETVKNPYIAPDEVSFVTLGDDSRTVVTVSLRGVISAYDSMTGKRVFTTSIPSPQQPRQQQNTLSSVVSSRAGSSTSFLSVAAPVTLVTGCLHARIGVIRGNTAYLVSYAGAGMVSVNMPKKKITSACFYASPSASSSSHLSLNSPSAPSSPIPSASQSTHTSPISASLSPRSTVGNSSSSLQKSKTTTTTNVPQGLTGAKHDVKKSNNNNMSKSKQQTRATAPQILNEPLSDEQQRELQQKEQLEHQNRLRAAASEISSNGALFLAATGDRLIRVWRAHTGQFLSTITKDTPVISLSFSPGMSFVVAITGFISSRNVMIELLQPKATSPSNANNSPKTDLPAGENKAGILSSTSKKSALHSAESSSSPTHHKHTTMGDTLFSSSSQKQSIGIGYNKKGRDDPSLGGETRRRENSFKAISIVEDEATTSESLSRHNQHGQDEKSGNTKPLARFDSFAALDTSLKQMSGVSFRGDFDGKRALRGGEGDSAIDAFSSKNSSFAASFSGAVASASFFNGNAITSASVSLRAGNLAEPSSPHKIQQALSPREQAGNFTGSTRRALIALMAARISTGCGTMGIDSLTIVSTSNDQQRKKQKEDKEVAAGTLSVPVGAYIPRIEHLVAQFVLPFMTSPLNFEISDTIGPVHLPPEESTIKTTLSKDGLFLAIAYDKRVSVWNLKTHACLWGAELPPAPPIMMVIPVFRDVDRLQTMSNALDSSANIRQRSTNPQEVGLLDFSGLPPLPGDSEKSNEISGRAHGVFGLTATSAENTAGGAIHVALEENEVDSKRRVKQKSRRLSFANDGVVGDSRSNGRNSKKEIVGWRKEYVPNDKGNIITAISMSYADPDSAYLTLTTTGKYTEVVHLQSGTKIVRLNPPISRGSSSPMPPPSDPSRGVESLSYIANTPASDLKSSQQSQQQQQQNQERLENDALELSGSRQISSGHIISACAVNDYTVVLLCESGNLHCWSLKGLHCRLHNQHPVSQLSPSGLFRWLTKHKITHPWLRERMMHLCGSDLMAESSPSAFLVKLVRMDMTNFSNLRQSIGGGKGNQPIVPTPTRSYPLSTTKAAGTSHTSPKKARSSIVSAFGGRRLTGAGGSSEVTNNNALQQQRTSLQLNDVTTTSAIGGRQGSLPSEIELPDDPLLKKQCKKLMKVLSEVAKSSYHTIELSAVDDAELTLERFSEFTTENLVEFANHVFSFDLPTTKYNHRQSSDVANQNTDEDSPSKTSQMYLTVEPRHRVSSATTTSTSPIYKELTANNLLAAASPQQPALAIIFKQERKTGRDLIAIKSIGELAKIGHLDYLELTFAIHGEISTIRSRDTFASRSVSDVLGWAFSKRPEVRLACVLAALDGRSLLDQLDFNFRMVVPCQSCGQLITDPQTRCPPRKRDHSDLKPTLEGEALTKSTAFAQFLKFRHYSECAGFLKKIESLPSAVFSQGLYWHKIRGDTGYAATISFEIPKSLVMADSLQINSAQIHIFGTNESKRSNNVDDEHRRQQRGGEDELFFPAIAVLSETSQQSFETLTGLRSDVIRGTFNRNTNFAPSSSTGGSKISSSFTPAPSQLLPPPAASSRSSSPVSRALTPHPMNTNPVHQPLVLTSIDGTNFTVGPSPVLMLPPRWSRQIRPSTSANFSDDERGNKIATQASSAEPFDKHPNLHRGTNNGNSTNGVSTSGNSSNEIRFLLSYTNEDPVVQKPKDASSPSNFYQITSTTGPNKDSNTSNSYAISKNRIVSNALSSTSQNPQQYQTMSLSSSSDSKTRSPTVILVEQLAHPTLPNRYAKSLSYPPYVVTRRPHRPTRKNPFFNPRSEEVAWGSPTLMNHESNFSFNSATILAIAADSCNTTLHNTVVSRNGATPLDLNSTIHKNSVSDMMTSSGVFAKKHQQNSIGNDRNWKEKEIGEALSKLGKGDNEGSGRNDVNEGDENEDFFESSFSKSQSVSAFASRPLPHHILSKKVYSDDEAEEVRDELSHDSKDRPMAHRHTVVRKPLVGLAEVADIIRPLWTSESRYLRQEHAQRQRRRSSVYRSSSSSDPLSLQPKQSTKPKSPLQTPSFASLKMVNSPPNTSTVAAARRSLTPRNNSTGFTSSQSQTPFSPLLVSNGVSEIRRKSLLSDFDTAAEGSSSGSEASSIFIRLLLVADKVPPSFSGKDLQSNPQSRPSQRPQLSINYCFTDKLCHCGTESVPLKIDEIPAQNNTAPHNRTEPAVGGNYSSKTTQKSSSLSPATVDAKLENNSNARNKSPITPAQKVIDSKKGQSLSPLKSHPVSSQATSLTSPVGSRRLNNAPSSKRQHSPSFYKGLVLCDRYCNSDTTCSGHKCIRSLVQHKRAPFLVWQSHVPTSTSMIRAILPTGTIPSPSVITENHNEDGFSEFDEDTCNAANFVLRDGEKRNKLYEQKSGTDPGASLSPVSSVVPRVSNRAMSPANMKNNNDNVDYTKNVSRSADAALGGYARSGTSQPVLSSTPSRPSVGISNNNQTSSAPPLSNPSAFSKTSLLHSRKK